MIGTIHQPEHLPWLGFFHKLNQAELFVSLDNVQYRKGYFQNRNKIRNEAGWAWITVPIEKQPLHTSINEIILRADNLQAREKSLAEIREAYREAPYFGNYWDEFQAVYRRPFTHLAPLNDAVIRLFIDMLGMKTEIVTASSLGSVGSKSDLILNLCRETGMTTYVSGISGGDYLDAAQFEAAGIQVVFQHFLHPIYPQLHEPFLPCMSVLDLLMNHGSRSMEIINGIGIPVMPEAFS